MDKINQEMAQRGLLSKTRDSRPAEKIARKLHEAGAKQDAGKAMVDDVERAKIRKLTKYYTELSSLYQQSLARLRDPMIQSQP